MRGQRPPASKKGTQRAVQASVTREKRSTATPAETAGDAVGPIAGSPQPHDPSAVRADPDQGPETEAVPFFSDMPTLQQPPGWLLSSISKTPFQLEPSDEEGPWAWVTSADASAILAGIGEFNADAAVVRPQPKAGPIAQVSLFRIETDYANLLALAISLEKMARDEIARLSGERPNDPQTIENNKKQCDLLSILADGFSRIAAVLVEYSERPQPLLWGKTQQIIDQVGAQLKAWWQINAAEATDWCIRLPMLTASIGALGLVGADMSFATPIAGVLVGGQKAATAIKAAIKRRKQS